MHRALAHHADRYEIPIQARSVSRIYVESGFDIQFFQDEQETAIRVENPLAVVTEVSRPLIRMQPEDVVPSSFVCGKIVVSGSGFRQGRLLEVVFNSGIRFWVDPQAEAAPSGLQGVNGVMIICMPGNEMAIWFGRRRKTLDQAVMAAMPEQAEPVART